MKREQPHFMRRSIPHSGSIFTGLPVDELKSRSFTGVWNLRIAGQSSFSVDSGSDTRSIGLLLVFFWPLK